MDITDRYTRIPVREFQLHASKYLKSLPLVLTRYNNEVAVVFPALEGTVKISYNEEEADIPYKLEETVNKINNKIYPQPKKGSSKRENK